MVWKQQLISEMLYNENVIFNIYTENSVPVCLYILKYFRTLSIIIMTIPDVSSMTRYVSPINPAVFPHLTVVLLGIGLFFTAWFFVYEV